MVTRPAESRESNQATVRLRGDDGRLRLLQVWCIDSLNVEQIWVVCPLLGQKRAVLVKICCHLFVSLRLSD